MNRCENCKVTVYPQHKACPLCGAELNFEGSCETSYPAYGGSKQKKRTAAKFFIFFSIATGITCVFINVFSWEYAKFPWSAIVCTVTAAFGVLISSTSSKTISPGAKLLNIYFAFIAAVVVIDLSSGFSKWSTTYVMPFSTITLTALLTILAIKDRKRHREYLGYLLAVFFISLCPIVVFLFSLSLLAWTSFVAALYSLLTAIGFWIFADKGFRYEMKKKFHI